MGTLIPSIDVETLRALDLHQAESRFDETKAQVLGAAGRDSSLTSVRTYLHAVEDILSERHEARRAGADAFLR